MPTKYLSAVPYYGGKLSKLAWLLPLLMPNNKKTFFVDACAGSAAVGLNWEMMFNKLNNHRICINDLDNRAYSFFLSIRDDYDNLRKILEKSPRSRVDYLRTVGTKSECHLENARIFFVQTTQSFGAMTGKSGFSRANFKMTKNSTRLEKLDKVAECMKDFLIENTDAISLLEYYGLVKNNLVFIDPPYPFETRTADTKCYNLELKAGWHEKMLKAAKLAKSRVAISSYENDMYNDCLAGWQKHCLAVTTSAGNKGKPRSPRIEVLYTNYSLPKQDLF